MKPACEPVSSLPKPYVSLKNPTNLARSPLLIRPRRKKTDRGQTSAFPLGTSRFAPLISAHRGVQHFPSSSTIELPSAFAESGGAYPPDRALPGSPRQCSLTFACRHTSRRAPNWSSEEARTWKHHPQPTTPPPRLNRQAESRRKPVGCISRG